MTTNQVQGRPIYYLLATLLASVLLVSCTLTIPPDIATSPVATSAALAPTISEAQANGMTIAYESYGSPEDETILLIAGVGMPLLG